MSKQFININGEFFPEDQPILKISNRSFKYGDGFFESMRWINGELKFADLHAGRIQKSLELLKQQSSFLLDHHFLNEKVAELIWKNKIGSNARIRLTVFRETGGLYAPTNNNINYVLEISKLNESGYTLNLPGLVVDVFDEVPKPINIISNIKTCNSLLFVLAGLFKNRLSLDDVLILNQNGFLCEALSSNVFVVYNNKIYTPDLSEGCVEGVMRRVVMKIAKENHLEVIEAQINPAILNEAEEVFLTNAICGIRWVMGFNDKRYFNKTSRFLANKLNQL